MTTENLALIIGLYALFAGLGMLLDPSKAARLLQELREEPVAAYLIGLIAFFFGAFMLAVHWRFGGPLEAVVTLVALAAAIEGAIMLVWPKLLLELPLGLVSPRASRVWGGAAALAGLVLVAATRIA